MQTENPTLSIITINRNNAEGLRKTMESVLTQDWNGFEYIIIDGNSTDNSVEVIKEFLSIPEYTSKISYWVSEPDTGIYNAMNKGIYKAHGAYCLFLNSGDYLINSRILTSVSKKMDFNNKIISGGIQFDNETQYFAKTKYNIVSYFNSFVPHPSTFIYTELLYQNGYYDENYTICSDYILFYKLIINQNIPYIVLNEVITKFDLTGISSVNQEKSINEVHSFYKKELTDVGFKLLTEYSNYYKNGFFSFFELFNKSYFKKLYKFLLKLEDKLK